MLTFSPTTLIYLRICFLLTLAFYCLKDPDYLLQRPFAILLARAMELPFVEIDPFNLMFGVLAYLFVILAVSDLIPLLEGNTKYFESQVPARLLILFSVATYSCIGSNYMICNNIVFVYSFMEIFFHALLFGSLKDEKYQNLKAREEKREAAEIEAEAEGFLYGEGGEDEDDTEYKNIVSDIRERVQNL